MYITSSLNKNSLFLYDYKKMIAYFKLKQVFN